MHVYIYICTHTVHICVHIRIFLYIHIYIVYVCIVINIYKQPTCFISNIALGQMLTQKIYS